MTDSSSADVPINACRELRLALLDMHRTLVQLERGRYERLHGPQSAGEFLRVVAFADDLRWLEPLSRLIVMLDEALDLHADATLTPLAVATRLRALLQLNRSEDGSFSAPYTAYFDTVPDLVHQHARTLAILKQFPVA